MLARRLEDEDNAVARLGRAVLYDAVAEVEAPAGLLANVMGLAVRETEAAIDARYADECDAGHRCVRGKGVARGLGPRRARMGAGGGEWRVKWKSKTGWR